MTAMYRRVPDDPATGLAGLTDRQAELVRHLVAHFREHQGWPTLREISELMGCNPAHPNAVRCHLVALRKKGLLTWEANMKARSIRLLGVTWKPCYLDTPEGARLRQILSEP